MCLGMVVGALFILSIVILGDKISDYYVWIAIFYAIGESLYWCSHELIYIDVTNNKNRKNYMSIKKISGKIIREEHPKNIEFISVTFDVLKFSIPDICCKDLQFLKISDIDITLFVSKSPKSMVCNFEQPLNMPFILVNSLVLKWLKSNDVKDSQFLNMLSKLLIFSVLNPDKSKSFKDTILSLYNLNSFI